MISVMNYKKFDRGSIKGFFDLRYHGLTIKGCRLMEGNIGLWFSFPQKQGEQNGEIKYYDQLFLSAPERDHVRRLVLLDLRTQGQIESASPDDAVESQGNYHSASRTQKRTSEGEDLTDHYTTTGEDDVPF